MLNLDVLVQLGYLYPIESIRHLREAFWIFMSVLHVDGICRGAIELLRRPCVSPDLFHTVVIGLLVWVAVTLTVLTIAVLKD